MNVAGAVSDTLSKLAIRAPWASWKASPCLRTLTGCPLDLERNPTFGDVADDGAGMHPRSVAPARV